MKKDLHRIYFKNIIKQNRNINFLNSSVNNKVLDIWIPGNVNRNTVQEFEWIKLFVLLLPHACMSCSLIEKCKKVFYVTLKF